MQTASAVQAWACLLRRVPLHSTGLPAGYRTAALKPLGSLKSVGFPVVTWLVARDTAILAPPSCLVRIMWWRWEKTVWGAFLLISVFSKGRRAESGAVYFYSTFTL